MHYTICFHPHNSSGVWRLWLPPFHRQETGLEVREPAWAHVASKWWSGDRFPGSVLWTTVLNNYHLGLVQDLHFAGCHGDSIEVLNDRMGIGRSSGNCHGGPFSEEIHYIWVMATLHCYGYLWMQPDCRWVGLRGNITSTSYRFQRRMLPISENSSQL